LPEDDHGRHRRIRGTSGGQDRAIGALLGLACGDAVGTTLEFRSPGSFTPIDDMVGGGPFGLKPGEWTDDTSMALCLAESLLDRGDLDPADQMRRYLLWWHTGYLSSNGRCFDIGNTVRSQLLRFEQTGEPVDPHPDQASAANGSLMRLAAVPIRWHTDVGEAAERSGESSRTTHGADRPVDACRVLGAMIAALVGGEPAEAVFDPGFWRWGDLHPAIAAVAGGSWRDKSVSEVRGTGFCVDALEAAVWAVGGARDFRDAVLRAANLGHDADTTAAIAGQLAGARWGASDIPADWGDKVVMRDRIEALASGLYDAALGSRCRPG
jgi:ADP-ribosylglycohydrolase